MNNISLKSIKYESIKAIISAISDADRISRAEISEKTDLSLVTVGKIADAMLDLNVVTQIKEVRPQAGRRAGLLSVNPNMFALILDITSYEFRHAILNLRLETKERQTFAYRSNYTFGDNLSAFLTETAAAVRRSYDMSDCIGVGVAVPGPYDAENDRVITSRIPELGSYHLKEALRRHFRDIPILVDSHINAAARSNIRHVEDFEKKNIIYWYVGPRNVCGVYVVGGQMILGKNGHACDFGSVRQLTEMTLEDKISLCKNQEETAEALALSVFNAIRVLAPHTMILDFALPYDCDRIIPIINDLLSMKYRLCPDEIPELRRAFCKSSNSHRGLTMGLRELWLNRIVYGPSTND